MAFPKKSGQPIFLAVDSNHYFQPSFFSKTRHFPRLCGGVPERSVSLERMEMEAAPRIFGILSNQGKPFWLWLKIKPQRRF